MAESLTPVDLQHLREIPNRDPAFYYSYFSGLNEEEKRQAMRDIDNAGKVPATPAPQMRLQRHEKLSQHQPWTVYTDPELDRSTPEDDYFPYQSYHYIMGYDDKGPVAVKPGQDVKINPGLEPVLWGRQCRKAKRTELKPVNMGDREPVTVAHLNNQVQPEKVISPVATNMTIAKKEAEVQPQPKEEEGIPLWVIAVPVVALLFAS